MKQFFTGTAILSLVLSSAAAWAGEKRSDFAHVISAEPIYQTIEHRIPRESCWTETVRISEPAATHHHSGTPAIIGGLIGGAIGHELGRGKDNRKLGAVVGTILGMSVANDIQRNHRYKNNSSTHSSGTYSTNRHSRYEEQERCELTHTIETEQVLKGYTVNYRYHGQEYSTFMREHPGNKIRVAVSVRPVHS